MCSLWSLYLCLSDALRLGQRPARFAPTAYDSIPDQPYGDVRVYTMNLSVGLRRKLKKDRPTRVLRLVPIEVDRSATSRIHMYSRRDTRRDSIKLAPSKGQKHSQSNPYENLRYIDCDSKTPSADCPAEGFTLRACFQVHDWGCSPALPHAIYLTGSAVPQASVAPRQHRVVFDTQSTYPYT